MGKIRSQLQPADVTSLEGFLFPDTYTFSLEDDEAAVAQRMVENFDSVAEELKLSGSNDKVGLTPYETLIVASLVEREAKLGGHAGVFVGFVRATRGAVQQVVTTRAVQDGGVIDKAGGELNAQFAAVLRCRVASACAGGGAG